VLAEIWHAAASPSALRIHNPAVPRSFETVNVGSLLILPALIDQNIDLPNSFTGAMRPPAGSRDQPVKPSRQRSRMRSRGSIAFAALHLLRPPRVSCNNVSTRLPQASTAMRQTMPEVPPPTTAEYAQINTMPLK